MGEEPDPEKMPLEPSDFPYEVQVAFFISSMLSERWEGNSGTYMGKDWTNVEYLFRVYEIPEIKVVLHFMHIIDQIIIFNRSEEQSKRRKAAERKSTGGKQYAHNVKG
jgi:hypothetical protein